MTPSSVLFFGGTFDPPHNGHLIIARRAAELSGASRVLLVPNAQSPHKQGLTSQTSSPAQRLGLLRAATQEDAFFDILSVELERPAPSYTYDTVDFLFRQGWTEVRWLIGADQLLRLPEWHRSAELLQRVRFVVAGRPGSPVLWENLPESLQHLKTSVVETPLIEISATDIRRRVREGRSVRYLVPERVEQYIREENLYR